MKQFSTFYSVVSGFHADKGKQRQADGLCQDVLDENIDENSIR